MLVVNDVGLSCMYLISYACCMVDNLHAASTLQVPELDNLQLLFIELVKKFIIWLLWKYFVLAFQLFPHMQAILLAVRFCCWLGYP